MDSDDLKSIKELIEVTVDEEFDENFFLQKMTSITEGIKLCGS